MENSYIIDKREFTLYEAASGDYCVTISGNGNEESYNLGSLEKAYAFILSYAEIAEEF